MNLVELKCHDCGANLKVDIDNIQAYCQYCGSKLLIDLEQVSDFLKEKEKTKQVIEKEQHITKRKEMEYVYKTEERKREIKVGLLGILILHVMMIFLWVFVHFMI